VYPEGRRAIGGRCQALLGGTTSWSECALALRFLLTERDLVTGSAIKEYEKSFAQKVGARHAFSFSAGRVGLFGLLSALGIGSGDEVLLQVPTHIVVPNAIRYTGATPVFVDCELETFNLDVEEAEKRISSRTRAIVLQHTFGIPADIDAVMAMSRRHGIEVIEDCVHALGATYRGKQVGSFGRAAFFSTEETKTITTTMGGMVVTDDDALAGKLADFQARCSVPPRFLTARYLLKLVAYHILNHPRVHRYARQAYEVIGRRNPLPRATATDELRGLRPKNYERRLSNAQAALGLSQLGRLEANLAHRRQIADIYARYCAEVGISEPRPPDGAVPAYVRFPIAVRDRAAAMSAASTHAVLGTWFTSVLEEADSPEAGGYEMGSCPRAEFAARHLVNLPTHPRVTPRDAELIVAAIGRLS
jgi:dTDP-4-amino-4,6-dideoxygalactose transaminase